MSGFEFHLSCENCGLASETYPWRYDRVVSPSSVELPAANRVRHVFERVSIPVAHALDERALADLAAATSSAEITVFVPHVAKEQGVELLPEADCPRCGRATIVARFGHRPEIPQTVASLDEAIAASRGLTGQASLSVRLDAPSVGLRCRRANEDGRAVLAWVVDRIGDASVAPVVDELIAKLTAIGSTCDEPKRLRAFTRFLEWPA